MPAPEYFHRCVNHKTTNIVGGVISFDGVSREEIDLASGG